MGSFKEFIKSVAPVPILSLVSIVLMSVVLTAGLVDSVSGFTNLRNLHALLMCVGCVLLLNASLCSKSFPLVHKISSVAGVCVLVSGAVVIYRYKIDNGHSHLFAAHELLGFVNSQKKN